ncbi:uncharacterized protein LOC131680714 [Topomyia yanbarensis]|uniref:uncharacterized protein LOC131680714 n=1 Tax=Topomyia yanbarensis TaxID=2498891 RepID=UPI00273C22C5|nr:uncharacterized protein LOC131680714 [Topomyia yanbarensis]
MSSMEDCSEYSNSHHHSQQQHHRHGNQQQQQHHQAKLSAALSSNALAAHHQGQGQAVQSGGPNGSNSTLTRGSRRSSFGPSHYQQQLVPQAVNFHDGLGMADNISVGSGSIISNHSGQRYVPDLQYGTLSNRIIHNERYVIDDSSCLQPPSPAPSNDHYVMGMPSPSPSAHHYPERHYALQQRTMSPSNSRYRHSLTENYRDMSPQCERFIPPPAHFLSTTNPLAAAESYGYLNSNVHTPVKRYVPTPPPQEPTYQPQTQLMTAILTQTAVTTAQQRGSHLTNTLPYRFRVKSCPNEQTISPPQGFDTSDHYATPPRVRPTKCSSSLTASYSVPNSALSSQAISSGRHSRQSNEYLIARTPSADFLDQPSCRVSTPVSVMSEPNGSASCLHCNTLRRTTGVHQTTQTSGPISPQPLPFTSATESTGRQSPLSPAASISTPKTTAPSPNSVQHLSHNHHQSQTQQLQHHFQQPSHVSSNALTATQSQPQIAIDNYGSLEARDISTIPRNQAKQHQQQSQHPSANSSEQSIMTSSNSRSILIQYQQQNILQQPAAQQQMQPPPPPAVQTVPPQQMIPQQAPQMQQQPAQPSQPQQMSAPVAPVSLPGPSMPTHSYFAFRGAYYRQKSGTAVGNPLSPALADLVMETLLDHVLETIDIPIPFLRKYVDDLVTALPADKIQHVQSALNAYNPHIQFTCEIESNNRLPYLDMVLIRTNEQKIQTDWYRKPVASGRILNYLSFHPLTQKLNTAMGFIARVFRLSTCKSEIEKKQTVREYLRNNNYPSGLINRLINRIINQQAVVAVSALFEPPVRAALHARGPYREQLLQEDGDRNKN